MLFQKYFFLRRFTTWTRLIQFVDVLVDVVAVVNEVVGVDVAEKCRGLKEILLRTTSLKIIRKKLTNDVGFNLKYNNF